MQTKVKNEFAIAKHVGQAMLFMLLLLTGPASVVLASGPVILGTDPADGARDVPIGANIVVNFGGPMDLSTINGDKVLVNDRPLSRVQGAAIVCPDTDARQAVILMRLHADNVYRITLPADIKDNQGNALGKPFTWRFATASQVGASDRPPKLFARYPRLNEWDIPTNAPVTMVFTTEMDPASLTPTMFIVRPTIGGDGVSGKMSVHGTRVVFRPDQPLASKTTFRVQVLPGMKSKAGLATRQPSTWQFTTAEGPAEGPVITDAWLETFVDSNQRKVIFHAAVDNLVQPGKASPSLKQATATTGRQVRAAMLPARELKGNRDAAKAQLNRQEAITLHDTGDFFNHGDRTKDDGMYSSRFILDEGLEGGAYVATFSVTTADGKQTEPVTIPTYISERPGQGTLPADATSKK